MNATPDPVSIGNVLERQVPLEWFEGVALVAGLCSALGDSDSPFIPKPDDVLLTPEGAVVIRGGTADDIAALPRLLSALLDGASPPAPLRLFVLHAVSSAVYKTAPSFGKALAYYERPNRTELVQSVYARFLETPLVPPPLPIEPIEQEEEAPETVPQHMSSRHARRWIAGVVAVAGVSVIALTVMTSRRTLAAFADTVVSSGALSSEGAVAASTPADPVVSDPLLAAGKRGGRTRPSAVRPGATTERSGAAREYISWTPETQSTVVGTAPEATSAVPGAELHPVLAPDPAIYTAETHGIEPPTLRDPERLPSAVFVVVGDVAHAIELIILESGAVGRVTLLTPSGRMTDMMLLSAAKTWTFEPAMKDGQPVKYRLLLNWAPFS